MKKESLISKNRIKKYLKQNDRRVGNTFYDALESKIKALLLGAVERSGKNGRSTVLDHDI